MAIGSAPEIGVVFYKFGDLTPDQHDQWYANIRAYGPDLMAGYATLHYVYPRERIPPLAVG